MNKLPRSLLRVHSVPETMLEHRLNVSGPSMAGFIWGWYNSDVLQIENVAVKMKISIQICSHTIPIPPAVDLEFQL